MGEGWGGGGLVGLHKLLVGSEGTLAVVVEEMNPREGRDDLVDVYANLYVERDSQKAIVIGRGGQRLKEVGSRARAHIEALLGTSVYLDLHVKVAKDWQRDPNQLRRLGF